MSTKQQGYLPLKQDEDISLLDNDNDKLNLVEKTHKCSLWKTIINLINCVEGVGLLALPYAISRGGISAVFGLLFAPFLMGYTSNLIVDCLYEVNEKGERIRVRSTYHEVGQHCWAPLRHVVFILVGLCTFISSVSFLVLSSTLLHQIFPVIPLTESQWACIAAFLVFPTVLLEYLSRIAWISVFAIIALVASVCLCLTYEFQEVHDWDVQSLLFWDTRGFVISFNIFILTYFLHTAVIQTEEEMAERSKFNIAIVFCFTISSSVKVVFALAGYLTYTSATKEVILANLPTGIPIQIIGSFVVINTLMTYPICMLIFIKLFEESHIHQKLTDKIHPKLVFVSLRVLAVCLTLAAAVSLPHFALVTSLAGCFSHAIGIILPGLFHFLIKYKQLSRVQVFVDLSITILGITAFGIGLVETLKELIMIWFE